MRVLIDAHPHICCPFWETGFFIHLSEMVEGDLIEILEKDNTFLLKRDDLIGWARESFLRLIGPFVDAAQKPRWAEKTPAHVYHLGLIAEVFPRAQFIHMIRNAYDVVRSLQHMPWAPHKLRWAIERWKSSVTAGREAGGRLSGNQYLEVRYEDLLRSPQNTVRELCGFLGEPYCEQMLEYHRPDANSWGQPQKPLSARPINQHPELSFLKKWVVRFSAGSLMRELGYR